jgi:UPF0755 protein
VSNDPSWEDIFSSQPAQPAASTPVYAPLPGDAPKTRRELREAEVGRGGSKPPKPPKGTEPKKKRRFGWLIVLFAFVIVVVGTGYYGWTNYEPQIREVLGIELPNDYEGAGEGDEVVVVIQSGQIGSDVAQTLVKQEVVMTFDAFYDLLLAADPQVNFQPGNYSLKKHMSAQAALDALQDPANKITQRVTIPEGTTLPSALALLAAATEIPVEDFQKAAKDLDLFGIPKKAPSLEGYLFPATYPLDPGLSAHDVLQILVDEMFTRLDAAGVAPADRHEVLTKAALIQREAGGNPDDYYKVARVFQNRLGTKGWKLQSDASVAYGTGRLDTVWTTAAERADASNKYNTYANAGLPIGPIGLPGDLAIDAALHPAKGNWFFFVPINLKTGETVFSETAAQHDAAVAKLQAWCAVPANATYCD